MATPATGVAIMLPSNRSTDGVVRPSGILSVSRGQPIMLKRLYMENDLPLVDKLAVCVHRWRQANCPMHIRNRRRHNRRRNNRRHRHRHQSRRRHRKRGRLLCPRIRITRMALSRSALLPNCAVQMTTGASVQVSAAPAKARSLGDVVISVFVEFVAVWNCSSQQALA